MVPKFICIKGVDHILTDAINRLDYKTRINTRHIDVHVRNMSLIKLFNGYVTKTTTCEAFQTDDVYVPISTRTFANQLESAHANYSTISFMPLKDCKRSATNVVDASQVKHHLKYLFANASAKDGDEIYSMTVSEIDVA